MKNTITTLLLGTALTACGARNSSTADQWATHQQDRFKSDDPPNTQELECIAEVIESYSIMPQGDGIIYKNKEGNKEEGCTKAFNDENGKYKTFVLTLAGTLYENYQLTEKFHIMQEKIDAKRVLFKRVEQQAERYKQQTAWEWGEYSTIVTEYHEARAIYKMIDTPNERYHKLVDLWRDARLRADDSKCAYIGIIATRDLLQKLEGLHVKLDQMAPRLPTEDKNLNPIETAAKDVQWYSFKDRNVEGRLKYPSPKKESNDNIELHSIVTGSLAGQSIWAIHSNGPNVESLVIHNPQLAVNPSTTEFTVSVNGKTKLAHVATPQGSIFRQMSCEPQFQKDAQPCQTYHRSNPQGDCGLTQNGWKYLDTLVEIVNTPYY